MASPLPNMLSLGFVVLLLGAMVESSTTTGTAEPKRVKCMNTKYKYCNNVELMCPEPCPDACMVDCASCKPVCLGGSNNHANDVGPAPAKETNTAPSSSSSSSSSSASSSSSPSSPSQSSSSSSSKSPSSSSNSSSSASSNGPSSSSNSSSSSSSNGPSSSSNSSSSSSSNGPSSSSNSSSSSSSNGPSSSSNSSSSSSTSSSGPSSSSNSSSSSSSNGPSSSSNSSSSSSSSGPSSSSNSSSSSSSNGPSSSSNSSSSSSSSSTSPPSSSSSSSSSSSNTHSSPSSSSSSSSSSSTTSSSGSNSSTSSTSSSSSPSSSSSSSSSSSTSPPTTTRKRVKCKNKNYGCYGEEHICPADCPTTCEVDCVTCKPVCRCDYPGAVCQDPRFIGGDGITFYFHGKKDKEFCLITDPNLHINAHFIGKQGPNMTRDFTWVQSLGILFDNHRLFIGAKKTAEWDDSVDRLSLVLNNEPLFVTEVEGATWHSTTAPKLSVTRTSSDVNSVVVEVERLFKITAKVVPITKKDSDIHNYGVTSEDSLAHLDLGFKFYSLSGDVEGVLGKTYREDYVSKVKMGINMPVLGGEKEYETTGLFSTDCKANKFVQSAQRWNAGHTLLRLPGLAELKRLLF